MYYVKFCRAPSQLWVGCTTYKNGTYFASGNTLDAMVERMKKRLYVVDRVPFSSVIIESKQSLPSEMPLQFMTKLFRTKYWNQRGVEMESQINIKERELPDVVVKEKKTTKPEYSEYTYKVKDGKLVLYGFVKIAEYPLAKDFTQTTPRQLGDVQIVPFATTNTGDNDGI